MCLTLPKLLCYCLLVHAFKKLFKPNDQFLELGFSRACTDLQNSCGMLRNSLKHLTVDVVWCHKGRERVKQERYIKEPSVKDVSVSRNWCFRCLWSRMCHRTTHLARRACHRKSSLCHHSSGAVWELRWTSWAVRPNEPSGFLGCKELLYHALALVTTCP